MAQKGANSSRRNKIARGCAGVAESADASDLKSDGRATPVRVQVPSPAIGMVMGRQKGANRVRTRPVKTRETMTSKAALDTAFEKGFFRMTYPSSWKKELQEAEASWQLSLQGPGTAFIVVAADLDASVEEMLEAALQTLKDDYPELEFETAAGEICGVASKVVEVRFFSFDFSNLCRLEAIPSDEGTLLFLFQCNDFDAETVEPVFDSIRASMSLLTE